MRSLMLICVMIFVSVACALVFGCDEEKQIKWNQTTANGYGEYMEFVEKNRE